MARTGLQITILTLAVIMLVLGIIYLRSQAGKEHNQSRINMTLIGSGGIVEVLDLDQIRLLESESGRVRYQNRMGNWGEAVELEGPTLATLIERVGGMEPGDLVRVTSTDGYLQEYSYYNLYPDDDWLGIQGSLILAHTSDGVVPPNWGDGPSTSFLPGDGEFSNDDSKHTSAPGTGFTLNPSAGARFVRNAWKLEVLARPPGSAEWALQMAGAMEKNLSWTEFGIMSEEYRVNVASGSRNWSGVPLWRLLGLIDGGPGHGDDSYNGTYWDEDYEIRVGRDGGISLSSHEVDGNDSVVLADMLDGEHLEAPVLVTRGRVVEEALALRVYPLWLTSVRGVSNVELHYSELVGLEMIEGRGGYLKVTGTVVGPYDIRGVELKSVLELSGDLPSEYSVEVTAADGYGIMLSKEEVEGHIDIFDLSGNKIGFGGATCVLYYGVDGSTDFSGKPFRLGYLKGEEAITDSHYWVKEVNKLTVRQPVTDWSLELRGLTRHSVNRTAFEAAATCSEHRAVLNITRKGETHGYQGLPIWVLISIVDGREDPEGHYFFNDDLARDGYDVRIVAADGASTTLNSTLLWRNDRIILAYLVDGEILPEGEGPLRVVGQGLSGKQMVKQVASIELLLPEEQ